MLLALLSKSSPGENFIGQVKVERVTGFKLLGIHTSLNLKWNMHTLCKNLHAPVFIETVEAGCAGCGPIASFLPISCQTDIIVLLCIVWHHGLTKTQVELEMWANAQPDGRPAEYR